LQQMRLVGAGDKGDMAGGLAPAASVPRRRLRRIGQDAALASAVALALLAVWWILRSSAPPKYVTATVSRGSVAQTVAATGTVNPVLTIIVGTYVSGVILDVYCDYTTKVRKGQLCAKIDPRPYQAALAEAKGQLARDMGQLAGARIDLARYATELRQDAVAPMTYTDEAALVRQYEGQVELDRASVQTAEVNLGYTNIVSPVDGTVVARNVTLGQTVAASFQTPTLFLIATDLTHMQVDSNVSESDVGGVRVGDSAEFTVEGFPGHVFRGRIVQVRQAPQVVQNVVTYDAVVGVANAQAGFLLMPGMTATVNIVTEQRSNVLRVPDQAFRFAPGGLGSVAPAQPGQATPAEGAPPRVGAGAAAPLRVWVLSGGKPVVKEVRAGLDDGTYSEIVAGDLRQGDAVIIGEERAATGPHVQTFRFGP
jgi:HlyD family secretion protein